MSNVVQFLETLARNPKPLSAEDLATAVTNSSLDSAVQQALLAGDTFALSEVLGGRTRMICMVAPAENDEPLDDDHQNDEDDSPEQEPASRAA
jgi:hypothetical protein